MSSVWSYLFDNDYRQRHDIDRLEDQMRWTSVSSDEALQRHKRLLARVERLELTVQALLQVVVDKGVTTRDDVSVLIQQLDLADGLEDGAARKRVFEWAPRCSGCGKFVNPQRGACVYCGAKVEAAPPPAAKREPPVQMVACGGCGRVVPARQTLYTEIGLRCDECYRP